MSNSQKIGLLIRACRESKGISQDYMADMLDIAQSAYANLESGKTTMSVDRLMRISEILQLDIHQIIEQSMQVRIYPDRNAVQHHDSIGILYPDTKEAYDLLILELRSEIEFLKTLVKKE